MFSVASMPDSIAVFPLPGALLLPRVSLPLHIFEPRYLTMLDDVLKTSHRLIGMVQPGHEPGSDSVLHTIGCAGRVTAFSETKEHRYMITLTGISRFRIAQIIDGFTPYRKCKVEWGDYDHDFGLAEHDTTLDRAAFLKLLKRYFEAQDLNTDWESLSQAEDELLINSLSMLCPFSHEDKQALLEAPCLSARRKILVTLLEFALLGGSTNEAMQ